MTSPGLQAFLAQEWHVAIPHGAGLRSYSAGTYGGGGGALLRASRLKFCWLYARQTQHAERRSLKGTFAKGLPQRRGRIVSGVIGESRL